MFRGLGKAVEAAGVNLQLAKLQNAKGDFPAAQNLAAAAAAAFEAEDLAVRGAYARITLALSLREQGREDDAIDEANRALTSLSGYHAKWVSYQCYDLMGSLHAAKGGVLEAERLYRKAIEEMESLRGNIQLDESGCHLVRQVPGLRKPGWIKDPDGLARRSIRVRRAVEVADADRLARAQYGHPLAVGRVESEAAGDPEGASGFERAV